MSSRSVWKGFLKCSVLMTPISLMTTTSKADKIHFHNVHEPCKARLRQKNVCEACGEEVARSEAVKGYEANGSMILISDDEIKTAEQNKSDSIDILKFVDPNQINPLWFDGDAFQIVPDKKGSKEIYSYLYRGMLATKTMGIALMVMRNNDHLIAIAPRKRLLVGYGLYFAEDMKDEAEWDSMRSEIEGIKVESATMDLTTQLITNLKSEFSHKDYVNQHDQILRDLVATKLAGQPIVPIERLVPKATDILSALQSAVNLTKQAVNQ